MAVTNPAASRSAMPPLADSDPLFRLIREKSFRRAPPGEHFVLASGERSEFFFDLKQTMLDPAGINLLADRLIDLVIENGAHYIGGLAMGAVPMVVATVLKSHAKNHLLRGFWVRKEQKDHGTKAKADGYLESGAEVVILEDVTTKGGSAMKAVAEARDRGCIVTEIITIIDRQEGAEALFAEHGIKLTALFRKEDFFR